MTRVEQIQVNAQHFKAGRGKTVASQTMVFIHYLREYYNRLTTKYLIYAGNTLLCKANNFTRAKRLARQAYLDFGMGSVRDSATLVTIHNYQ